MMLPPTRAIRSFSRGAHAASAARSRRLARICRGVIVENLPAIGSALHHEGEGTAGSGTLGVIEDEPGGYESKGGAERPDIELLEPQAVAGSSWRKPRRVVAPDDVDSFNE